MRKIVAISAVIALFVSSLAVTALADDNSTGLDRAAEATMQGLEKSQGKAADAPGQQNRAKGLNSQGDKLTGRERAAAAIAAALERGNGNGNAFGRGRAAYIHEILAGGGIPGQLNEENYGQAVREMVQAYNQLRRSQESP